MVFALLSCVTCVSYTRTAALRAAVRGAAASAVTQGIATVTGLQDSFSFAGVAEAGVAAGVGHGRERAWLLTLQNSRFQEAVRSCTSRLRSSGSALITAVVLSMTL